MIPRAGERRGAARRAQRQVPGSDHERAQRVLRHVEEHLAGQHRDQSLACVEGIADPAVGAERDRRSVVQSDPANLARAARQQAGTPLYQRHQGDGGRSRGDAAADHPATRHQALRCGRSSGKGRPLIDRGVIGAETQFGMRPDGVGAGQRADMADIPRQPAVQLLPLALAQPAVQPRRPVRRRIIDNVGGLAALPCRRFVTISR